MTAWAYDEPYPPPEGSEDRNGRKDGSQRVMRGLKEGKMETYTSLDQARFSRRGACFVAEAQGEEDGVKGES